MIAVMMTEPLALGQAAQRLPMPVLSAIFGSSNHIETVGSEDEDISEGSLNPGGGVATRVMPSHLAVERINLASHSYGPPVPEDNNDNSNGVTPGIETSPPDDVDLYGNIEECDESTNPSNRSNESVSLPSFSAEVTNFSGIYKSTKYLIFAGIASISPK